jgi:hypothetical protein
MSNLIGRQVWQRILIAMVLVAAALQWGVVVERLSAAAWAWYKFSGYGGGGHIVLGPATQTLFILGSTVLAASGYVLSKRESQVAGSQTWSGLAQLGWISIAICTLLWIGFLFSPFAAFRPT